MADEPEPQAAMMLDAEQPLVLVGPPRGVRGEFSLQNPTDRKVIIREPRVRPTPAATGKRAAAGKGAAAAAVLSEAPMVMRRIIMRPGQSRPIPVALALDPRTPPGTYNAELEIQGQQRTVVIHVLEEVSLTIAPREIVLPNRPGEKVEKRVIFTNDGNVPISVRTLGTVILDEELVHCRALRGALSDVGETMESLNDFVAALGRRYQKLYETLVLKVQNTAVTIDPGQTQAVDLTITLPEKLESRSRYSGYAAISTNNLTFTVVPD
jgi:hypothetical protein